MKNRVSGKFLSLLTVAALLLSMTVSAFAAQDDTLTRGQMAAQLVEAAGLSDQLAAYAVQPSVFQDVDDNSAYKAAINLAYDKGLISGTGGGSFSPDAAATQLQAAAVVLKAFGIPASQLTAWPADYNEMTVWSGLADGLTYEADKTLTQGQFAQMLANGAAVAEKPVIGISWAYNDQADEYAYYKTVIKTAGGIPVELDRITNSSVAYDAEGMILSDYIEESGNLKLEYADVVKSNDFTKSNVASALTDIDGVFFTGGEDISPNLFATPTPVDNEGEEINATRDISDYTLMAYCIERDIPTFAVCRGQQMMSIVSGCTFIQDIPNYYAAQDQEYNHLHRMPVGTPNRDYERHDVDIFETGSKWLYNIVGSTELKNVSSWHHQAVEGVEGTNLTVVAKTTYNGIDIIEAVERQDKTFCLGVQFHPENDCGIVLYDNEPEKALCDFDVCMGFFTTLVEYAAS